MTSSSEMGREVEQRAAGRCEYCRMSQSLQGATFHIEHVIPRCLGGSAEFDNLAWACPSCNLHKSNRVEVEAPGGRATIDVLLLNHERRIKIRQTEALFDLFPPGDAQP